MGSVFAGDSHVGDIGGHKSREQLLKIFPQQRKRIKYANVAWDPLFQYLGRL